MGEQQPITLSRRSLLKRGAAYGAVIAASGALAGCGINNEGQEKSAGLESPYGSMYEVPSIGDSDVSKVFGEYGRIQMEMSSDPNEFLNVAGRITELAKGYFEDRTGISTQTVGYEMLDRHEFNQRDYECELRKNEIPTSESYAFIDPLEPNKIYFNWQFLTSPEITGGNVHVASDIQFEVSLHEIVHASSRLVKLDAPKKFDYTGSEYIARRGLVLVEGSSLSGNDCNLTADPIMLSLEEAVAQTLAEELCVPITPNRNNSSYDTGLVPTYRGLILNKYFDGNNGVVLGYQNNSDPVALLDNLLGRMYPKLSKQEQFSRFETDIFSPAVG